MKLHSTQLSHFCAHVNFRKDQDPHSTALCTSVPSSFLYQITCIGQNPQTHLRVQISTVHLHFLSPNLQINSTNCFDKTCNSPASPTPAGSHMASTANIDLPVNTVVTNTACWQNTSAVAVTMLSSDVCIAFDTYRIECI